MFVGKYLSPGDKEAAAIAARAIGGTFHLDVDD
jgi:hypothetical protein